MSNTKKCPFCAETIQEDAQKCRYCREWLNSDLSIEVREYYREIGRKRGNDLKKRYGSEYFKKIAAKRKTFGRKSMEKNSMLELAKRFNISRQRAYQIIVNHGYKFNKANYVNMSAWREAVIENYFKTK